MKKYFIAASLMLGSFLFTACESDRDDNPTLQEPDIFVLNTPAYVSGVYDLEHSKTLELTCSQPNYGYTAPVTYAVEVSLSESFETMESLPSTYKSAKMDVMADELAVAATNLKVAAGATEADFPLETAIYIRLRASLGKDQFGQELGVITSNVILLPHVRLHFALPPVELPEILYINGNGNWDWATAPSMVPVNGALGVWWRMIYLSDEFKFNSATEWNGQEVGYGQCVVNDNANAGITGNSTGENFKVTNSGWYLVIITGELDGRNIKYTMNINEPAVYLIGGVIGGAWDECLPQWKFEVPTAKDGEFVSPAFSSDASDGIRAYVKVPGYDWWKAEFMVFDGKLKYRGNGGDQERIAGLKGQKLHINFAKGTGSIE